MSSTAVNAKHEDKRRISFTKPCVVSTAFALLLLLVFSLLFAVMFAATNVPINLLTPMAVFSLAAASFAGGFFAARLTKAKGLTIGLVTGGALYLVLFLLSILIVRNGVGAFALAKLLLMLSAAAVGGVSGVNMVRKRK